MLVGSRGRGGGDGPGPLGATQQALSGAFVDPETPDTNVVVAVDSGCTGTLITPRIVLTANHCIYGAQINSSCTPKTPGNIGIGATTLVDRKYVLPYVDAETMTNACQVSGELANDLGVIYMATPVTQSAFQKNAASAIIPRVVRPSLLGPVDAGFASDGGTFGVAGFSTVSGQLSRRSLQLTSSPSFSFPFAGGNDTWYLTPSGWDTESGDSGGPLFYRHPNGRLDVLGALSGHLNSQIVWPAVTSGANRAWLLAHVLESNVPAALRHSAPWLSRHGQTSSTWWGELDYSGPCDPAVDRDCDGWWDHGVATSLIHVHLWRPYVGWSTIVPSIAFAKAKTATFSPADGQLWILEQRTRSYTLSRMSPWTGVTQVLGTWTRGTIWDQHFLAVDRDGQVLLLAASKGNVQSKFARLRVNTGGGAYASQIDADSIPYTTSSPIVDKDEYGVIVRDTTGAVTSVYRRANLLGGTGTFTLDAFFQ